MDSPTVKVFYVISCKYKCHICGQKNRVSANSCVDIDRHYFSTSGGVAYAFNNIVKSTSSEIYRASSCSNCRNPPHTSSLYTKIDYIQPIYI